MIKDRIKYLRTAYKHSEEELAAAAGVTAEDVKAWESGDVTPTVEQLTALGKFLNVQPEYFAEKEGGEPGLGIYREVSPKYDRQNSWEYWPKALLTEYRQCYDEGLDVEKYSRLFAALEEIPFSPEKEKMCDALFTLITKLPLRKDYPYVEPNDIGAIREERNGYAVKLEKRDVADSMLGGWYGRICGCLLGKPIEGMRTSQIKTVCEDTDNYPLSRYFVSEEVTAEIQQKVGYWFGMEYPKAGGYMPADDDTNYMLIALNVLERYGRDFKSEDMMQYWLNCQTKNGYCTAERNAYVNFIKGFYPPESAEYKNAYREWIGAQIRGDVFGYVNPCNAEVAAEMAWRDARISHVKNGIYGEMWVAAMLATAYGTTDIPEIIRGGLAQVPKKSRLFEAVEKICAEYENGRSAEDTFRDIATRWNEANGYDWCHTISNAEIVSACLLYGEKDYGKSICMAVSQGFDTDCNGATVGSVLGVALGYKALPKEWTDHVGDTLRSTLIGVGSVSITGSAERCMKFIVE